MKNQGTAKTKAARAAAAVDLIRQSRTNNGVSPTQANGQNANAP